MRSKTTKNGACPLIGVAGYGRVGKDSVCATLTGKFGYDKRAFADGVREVALAIDAYIPEAKMRYSQLLNGMAYQDARDSYPFFRDHLSRIKFALETILERSGTTMEAMDSFDRETADSFDDKIKEFASHLNVYFPEIRMTYNEILKGLGYENAKTRFPSIREYLVNIGHGARETFGDDFWVNAIFSKHAVENGDSFDSTCLSDVRYESEGRKVHESGGEVWMIKRPGVGPANETERESVPLIKYDVLIVNDGTKEDLDRKVIEQFNLCKVIEQFNLHADRIAEK